jgi:hypothetical protein
MLRLALEDALRELWLRTHPAVADVSMRAQMISLRVFDSLDPSARARADHLWACLSRAGHYHSYELSPTAAELRGWHADVSDLVTQFRTIGPTRRRTGDSVGTRACST